MYNYYIFIIYQPYGINVSWTLNISRIILLVIIASFHFVTLSKKKNTRQKKILTL